jgi:hypothetical protein
MCNAYEKIKCTVLGETNYFLKLKAEGFLKLRSLREKKKKSYSRYVCEDVDTLDKMYLFHRYLLLQQRTSGFCFYKTQFTQQGLYLRKFLHDNVKKKSRQSVCLLQALLKKLCNSSRSESLCVQMIALDTTVNTVMCISAVLNTNNFPLLHQLLFLLVTHMWSVVSILSLERSEQEAKYNLRTSISVWKTEYFVLRV